MARDPEHPAPTTTTQRRPGRALHASATARPSRATRPPKGAALRRRETRNLGRYHRARPRGWPKRSEPELFGSSLPKPLTRSSPKEPDVTSGLKKKGASGASAPVSEGYPRTRELLGARRGGSEWLRPLALGTVSEESALEGDGGWREGWGKGSRPA